jgi:hypothetical protein
MSQVTDNIATKFNAHQYRGIMLRRFNIPNYDCINVVPLSSSYYYNKMKGNSVNTAINFRSKQQLCHK